VTPCHFFMDGLTEPFFYVPFCLYPYLVIPSPAGRQGMADVASQHYFMVSSNGMATQFILAACDVSRRDVAGRISRAHTIPGNDAATTHAALSVARCGTAGRRSLHRGCADLELGAHASPLSA